MADAVSPKEAEFNEVAELLYDLFRAAPIPVTLNGDRGKAAFFTKEAQLAQAKSLLTQIFEAGERKERERCAKLCDKWADHVMDTFRDQALAVKHRAEEIRGIRGGESTT